MADLLAQTGVKEDQTIWNLPFPSLDELNKSCDSVAESRDLTAGVENAFLAAKDALRFILDPLTQPLSWLLDFALGRAAKKRRTSIG